MFRLNATNIKYVKICEKETHQSISSETGTLVHTAPEVLETNKYRKSMDIYSFSLIVYEILTNEKPFDDIDQASGIYQEVVVKGKRPIIKEKIPDRFKVLIEECWSQDLNQRPSFDDIIYLLKIDEYFIIEEVSKEDYYKYIDFIDSHAFTETGQKVDENNQEKILEYQNDKNSTNEKIEFQNAFM